MPAVKVYHNLDFLNYRGDHSQIVPPIHPVATVHAGEDLPLDRLLDAGYARTQHLDTSWYNNPDVVVHLRSTSVGDVVGLADGSLHVVESFGFKLYQPQVVKPINKLADACRLLQGAVDGGDIRHWQTLTRQAILAVQYALASEGYPERESPILWEQARVGDLVGEAEVGQYRVLARKLRPKWRAKQLLEHIPNAQIWIDGPRSWAVLVPAANTEEPLI